jgi:hypothetical protein
MTGIESPHYPTLCPGTLHHDAEGRPLPPAPFNTETAAASRVACIYKYWTKSVEEFNVRNGRVAVTAADFYRYDHNDTLDTAALEIWRQSPDWDKMPPVVPPPPPIKGRFAICYFGALRTIRRTIPSHYSRLYFPLQRAKLPYDVFVHAWDARGKTLRVWENRVGATDSDGASDLELFPDGTTCRLDDQDEFLESLRFEDYYSGGAEEWDPLLLRNHLCALQSQKRCFEMMEEASSSSTAPYDWVIAVRPDAELHDDLPIDALRAADLSKPCVWIPSGMQFEGYNDRFALGDLENMRGYMTRFDRLLEYRASCRRVVAEGYLKWTMDRMGLTPRLIRFGFGLVRPEVVTEQQSEAASRATGESKEKS